MVGRSPQKSEQTYLQKALITKHSGHGHSGLYGRPGLSGQKEHPDRPVGGLCTFL